MCFQVCSVRMPERRRLASWNMLAHSHPVATPSWRVPCLGQRKYWTLTKYGPIINGWRSIPLGWTWSFFNSNCIFLGDTLRSLFTTAGCAHHRFAQQQALLHMFISFRLHNNMLKECGPMFRRCLEVPRHCSAEERAANSGEKNKTEIQSRKQPLERYSGAFSNSRLSAEGSSD